MKIDQHFRRGRAQSQRGFTILELMLVVAIIGTLTGLASVEMSAWTGKMRTKEAAHALANQIQAVRAHTISGQANRVCLKFSTDYNYNDNNGEDYLIGVYTWDQQGAPSTTWDQIYAPVEMAGWANNATTARYRGVSLEDGGDTTQFAGDDNCSGLVFNSRGYLDNPASDFTDCGGWQCAKLTLRNKNYQVDNRRTLCIDRGGNVRHANSPDGCANHGP